MMPVSAVWAGPEMNRHLNAPPLMMAETRGSTPFRLDLHVGDVGHTLIVGPTGAGKSVLLSLLALQFRRFIGAQVVHVRQGRSARAAMLAMGGESIELGLEGTLSLQPLARIDEPGEIALAAAVDDRLLDQRRRQRHARGQGRRVDGAAEPGLAHRRRNAR